MTIELKEEHDGKVLTIHASDQLTFELFDHFLPEAQRLIQRFGNISVLFDMRSIHVREINTLWEDIKYGMIHFRGFERLAIIGDKQREGFLSMFCRPFTTAEIQFFDQNDAGAARKWIDETVTSECLARRVCNGTQAYSYAS